jgi:hypothetical protein
VKKWKIAAFETVGVIKDDVLTKRFTGNWRELSYRREWQPENVKDESLSLYRYASSRMCS